MENVSNKLLYVTERYSVVNNTNTTNNTLMVWFSNLYPVSKEDSGE